MKLFTDIDGEKAVQIESFMLHWTRPVEVRFLTYAIDVSAPAIVFVDPEGGERVVTATVYVNSLGPREVAIKDYAENAGVLATLLAAGIVEGLPKRIVQLAHVDVPVFELAPKYMAMVPQR